MIYTDRKNLYADTVEELHAFAKKSKLHKSAFSETDDLPNYVLTHETQRKVLYNGARLITTRDLIDIFGLTSSE